MDYTSLITRNKQYKYSANVCFDLRNASRLSGFIPNETTTEILREYIGDIIKGRTNTHSRILYGSYGTGKSHLLTVIGAILGHINTNGNEFKQFAKMIEKYDSDLASDLRGFAKENQAFLVVPIYTDYPDFSNCIAYSLKKELEAKNIEVAFSGFFDEALILLKKWLKGTESKKRVEEECKRLSLSVTELKRGLEAYDSKYESIFRKIYEAISYGADFNTTAGSLIGNLDKANAAIAGKYKGIVFIFDEFGRYIEDNGDDIRVKDIQDMAEYCDHSEYDNHLILVSHKQLSMYTDDMKKTVSDEWKKVEGRFKATSINIKYDQCLSLIGNIIPKTANWDSFKKRFVDRLNELYNQAWDFKGFLIPAGSAEEKEGYFEDGYPLHPITLYALDRLSKKVAQNERTYFTYLAGDEDYSMSYQLQQYDVKDFHFIGLDAIYDYFEFNIRAYKTDESYEIYKKLQYAMSKLGLDHKGLPARILKAMAVIFIIGDSSVLISDRETLMHVVDSPMQDISSAIDMLEQKKIIKYMRQYGYYDYFDSSIFDLDTMIEEKLSGVSEEMIITVLNDDFSDFAVYPHAYNERFHMNRVLLPVFARKEDLNRRAPFTSIPKYYDGVVIFVLDNNAQQEEYKGLRIAPDRAILHVNGKSRILEQEVRRYLAIQYYYSKRNELAKDDPTVVKELELYLNEQRAIIAEIIRNWRNYKTKGIFTVLNGEVREITTEWELSKLASELMFNTFPQTIIVNNDIVNKNNVSGAIKQARKKALESIMSEKDMYSDCAPLSPECNIIRSVLSMNGIGDAVGIPQEKMNRLEDGTVSGEYVMRDIRRFLCKAEQGQYELSKIYEKLKQEPYGLRDGYIPVLLSFAMREYQNVSIYFHGTEHDYTAEELVKALEESENYSLYICNWNSEQQMYIERLESLFEIHLAGAKGTNRLKRLYTAMNSHYASISKSARTTEKYVSGKAMKYRDILNVTHTDYNKFFFETLTEIDYDIQSLSIRIKNIKEELESVPGKLIKKAEKAIRDTFNLDEKTSIAQGLTYFYKRDWEEKSSKAFDYSTNSFLEYLSSLGQLSDAELVESLSKILTGFEIEFWSDNKIEDFSEILRNIKVKLDEYVPTDELGDGDVKMTLEYGNQAPVITRFSDEELSINGQMMLNKMKTTINNFGESLSYEEKLNVMSLIFKEIINRE